MKIVRHGLLMLLGAVILHVPAYAAGGTPENQAYFTLLNDIPLMPDMKEMTDQSFVFDKAEGRVVETVGFLSASSVPDVIKYYQSALDQLGWKPLKSEVFERNGEQLLLKTEKVDEGILVRFQLSPLSR